MPPGKSAFEKAVFEAITAETCPELMKDTSSNIQKGQGNKSRKEQQCAAPSSY